MGDTCASLIQLFPKDGSVDWLFFNIFQTVDTETYDRVESHGGQQANWNPKTTLDLYYNFFNNHSDEAPWGDIPWGIGAWGTNYQNTANPPVPLPTDSRTGFITELKNALTSGNYSKIKAAVYFDNLFSLITPYDVNVTQQGDQAHNFSVQTYPNSKDLVSPFEDYLSNDMWADDKGFI